MRVLLMLTPDPTYHLILRRSLTLPPLGITLHKPHPQLAPFASGRALFHSLCLGVFRTLLTYRCFGVSLSRPFGLHCDMSDDLTPYSQPPTVNPSDYLLARLSSLAERIRCMIASRMRPFLRTVSSTSTSL